MKLLIDIDEELYKNVVEHTKTGYVGSDVWIAVANGKPYGTCYDCKKNLEEETHVDCFECSHHYRNKFESKESKENDNGQIYN